MIVYATKLTVKKALVGLLAVAAVVWGIAALAPGGMESVAAAASGTADLSRKLKTNEERAAFLRSFGWEIDDTPLSETEVRIPDEFDAAYQSYNELQRSQGLDLEKYKGRKCMLYVYAVRNDPSGEEGVTASLVLYKNKLIAADICSADADGFIHGVTERPAPKAEE